MPDLSLASNGTLPVLMYHHVNPVPGALTITPAHFAAQMHWLAEHGYSTLGSAGIEAFLAGEPVPKKSVVLTFDDGLLDNYVHAHPVLQRYGLHAVMFLVTGWNHDGPARPHAGESSPVVVPSREDSKALIEAGSTDDIAVRWSEIERMRAAGTFEFHSHTHTHTRWDRVCASREEKTARLREDLALSQATLHARLGEASRHLCWPQGYFDDDYLQVARQAGFRYLYTTRDTDRNRPGSDPGHLYRIGDKGKAANWIARKLWLVRHPLFGAAHYWLKQRKH